MAAVSPGFGVNEICWGDDWVWGRPGDGPLWNNLCNLWQNSRGESRHTHTYTKAHRGCTVTGSTAGCMWQVRWDIHIFLYIYMCTQPSLIMIQPNIKNRRRVQRKVACDGWIQRDVTQWDVSQFSLCCSVFLLVFLPKEIKGGRSAWTKEDQRPHRDHTNMCEQFVSYYINWHQFIIFIHFLFSS